MDMKKLVLTLAFCLAILTTPALAQDTQPAAGNTPTLANLEIALWPEYDRPEVLVIYRGLLAPETALPALVEIRIPSRVGQPTAVAYVDESGQRFNQQHTTRIEGDQLVVSFELSAPGFQLEYYDDLGIESTGTREYAYTHTADYPITLLNLEFQVPPTADGFTLDPPADSVVSEGDGLTYHLVQMGPVAQGETGDWTLAYQKDDEELTVSGFIQASTPAPAAQQEPPTLAAQQQESTSSAAGGSDNTSVLIFLVAFVALVGVGAGAFWLGRRAQSIPETAPPPKQRREPYSPQRPEPQRLSSLPDLEGASFCHKCGAQVRHDADFCHKCGAAVRSQ